MVESSLFGLGVLAPVVRRVREVGGVLSLLLSETRVCVTSLSSTTHSNYSKVETGSISPVACLNPPLVRRRGGGGDRGSRRLGTSGMDGEEIPTSLGTWESSHPTPTLLRERPRPHTIHPSWTQGKIRNEPEIERLTGTWD